MSLVRHSARAACTHATALAATALVLFVAVSHRADAQRARDVSLPNPRQSFEDSWFWGVKGGAVRFGTVSEGRVTAPSVGGEWLITRRRGAVLVAAEQMFFDRTSIVADPYTTDGMRNVAIKDARRYSAAALATPVAFGRLRPYAGIGLALQVIRDASPTGDFATQAQYAQVSDRIDAGQSSVVAFLVGGMQANLGRFAIFAQANTASGQQRSLWNLGGTSQVEGGIRYNLSSAFER
jgi:hypothetical protein